MTTMSKCVVLKQKDIYSLVWSDVFECTGRPDDHKWLYDLRHGCLEGIGLVSRGLMTIYSCKSY